jgi:hypothetical protein
MIPSPLGWSFTCHWSGLRPMPHLLQPDDQTHTRGNRETGRHRSPGYRPWQEWIVGGLAGQCHVRRFVSPLPERCSSAKTWIPFGIERPVCHFCDFGLQGQFHQPGVQPRVSTDGSLAL